MNDEAIVEKAKNIVLSMLSALVDYHDKAEVHVEKASSVLLIRIVVDRTDTGKVIGRGGRNATAIRYIMGAFGARYKLKSIVEIDEGDRRYA